MLEKITQQISESVQELDFDQSVVNIGSNLDNDIVITGDNVLPFHAMVILQEKKFQLVSLTPDAEIWLNGSLLEDSSVSLTENHLLEIGEHTLFFQQFASSTGMHVIVSQIGADVTSLTSRFAMGEGEKAILVNILSQQADVNVEQRAVFELEVVNAGPIVASFFVSIKGVPQDWVKIKPDVFNLNEGQRAMVSISITPPRIFTSTAGIYDVNIIVSSPNYPGYRVETPSEMIVQPYYEFALGNLSPKRQRISWRKRTGVSNLPITNRGNNTTDFSVTSVDDENGCSFDFRVSDEVQLNRQATLSIPAGETLDLPIEITPLKHPMFALRSKRYHYTTTVTIPQQVTSPQIISASVVSRPLFGWWSIMLGVLAVLVGLFILLQPRIFSFQVATGKDVIELGDTTKLEWSVSPFATRLGINNIDYPISRGQESITIAPTHSTTYELVSGNWLSGLVNLDRKESQTILVVPPSPSVGVFEVDATTIDKGKPINIRWSVTEADQVFLTVDEVVYELTPEQFSGEQAYILEKDALVTLEAKNASGSELRSYFVNVVPPHITVDSFTVWVKSQNAAANYQDMAADSAGGHLASRLYVPDANFPERLVTLVPDATSDSGYRAESLQPDRELAKGEQVLLEWSIKGVDTVQIAPFTEVLPSTGMQPFFPQESMNFVMSAKSGELERLFMLPVKVFDGEPPVAPTIEFFEVSPSKMVGEGEVEFAWSVSGEWTRVQLSSGENVIADHLNPQGFKTITVDATKSFILTAWNGELTSAEIIEVVVDPALIDIDLTITEILPAITYFRVWDTVDVFVDFTDPETGEQPDPYPKGAVVISDGRAVCTIALPTRTCSLTFNAAGTKTDENGIKASYEGDAIYLPADSEAFSDRSIIVEANQVELNPVYYHLSQSGDAGAQINNLSAPDPELSVGRGLFIDVIVKPVNKPLDPADDKGQVTVRHCPLVNGEVQEQECITALPATVVVDDTDTGHAEVAIRHFPEVGDYALLISYNHREDAYEPVSLGEDGSIDFTIEKGQIVFIPDGKDPCDTEECILIGNQSGYTFFAKLLIEAGWLKTLSTTYLEPNSISMVLKDGDVVIDDWSEECVWKKSGDTWQYVCEGVSLDQPATLEYSFEIGDDNYKIDPVPDKIRLNVKESTTLDFPNGTDFLSGKYTGTVIDIQPDGIVLKKETGSEDPIAGDIELTVQIGEQEIASLSDYFIVTSGTTNCTISGAILTITQDEAVTGVCKIAFKKAGDYTLNFEYQGDSDYNGSTASKPLTIEKQTGIEVEWAPDGPFSWHIFTKTDETLTFSCPASTPSCDGFEEDVFKDAKLQVVLPESPDCNVSQGTSELTNGEFALSSSSILLSFRCVELGNNTLDLNFATPSNDDFALAVGGEPIDLEITPLPEKTEPEIRIDTGEDLILIGTPDGDNISNTEWWVGEEYWVTVVLNGMPEDAEPSDDKVEMTWPLALTNALSGDSTKTNCPTPTPEGTNKSVFALDFNKPSSDSTKWEAKCKFTFTSTVNHSGKDISFELVSDRFTEQATDLKIDLPNGVIKRTPTIEVTTPPSPVFAYSGPTAEIEIVDGHYQENAIDDTNWKTRLSVEVDGTNLDMNSCTKNGDTIECPLNDDAAWSGDIIVTYTATTYFKTATKTVSNFEVKSIPVKLTSADGNFPEVMQCENCSSGDEFFNPTNYAFKNVSYTLTFKLDSDTGDEIDKGYVVVRFKNGGIRSGDIDYSGAGITEHCASASGWHCDYKIPVSGNQATFSWKTTKVYSTVVKYSYSYSEDDGTFIQSSEVNNGWVSSTNSRWRNRDQFTIDTWYRTADSRNHLKITDLTSTATFKLYVEVKSCTTPLPSDLTCEGDAASCWNGTIIVGGDSSGEDGKVVTDPNWARLVGSDYGCQYQIFLIDESTSTLYFGWEHSDGW